MEEEFDPILERRAREAKESKTRKLTVLVIALGLVAVGLCGSLYYVWNKYNGEGVRAEKTEVQNNLLQLRAELDDNIARADNLDLRNNLLADSLDVARLQVDSLLTVLQQTTVSSRRQLESYKKELATLRTIMRGYVTQLDSLNTLNQKLIAENRETRSQLRESQRENESLRQAKEELESRVAVGEKLKARGVEAHAERRNGKATEKHRDVERLVISFTLAANDLARLGEVNTYVRVLDPDETLLVNDRSTGFEVGGNTLAATAFRAVEYAGEDLSVTVYVNDIEEYIKGIYKVEVYTDGGLLGTTTFSLR